MSSHARPSARPVGARRKLVRGLAKAAVPLALVSAGGFAYQPAASAATAVHRINAGGGSVTDSFGRVWSSDRYFLSGGSIHDTGIQIAGTSDDIIFMSDRWGMAGYDIPVARNRTYAVRLLFAETVLGSPGARVFDVSVEGQLVLDDLDVFARAGWATAYSHTSTVRVKDRTLNIRFGSVVEDPAIAGIEVIEVASGTTTTTAPPSPTTTTVAPATTTTVAPTPTTTAPPTPTTTAPPAPTTTTTTPPPPAPAPTGGYPGPSNTGVPVGTALRPSGSITTSYAGQVIDSMDVVGSIQVRHDNVTIRRTRVRQPGGAAISINGNVNLVVEDCELDGTGNPTALSAIAEHNYTMRRCNVHHFGEGPRVNGNVLIEDNWFHDFVSYIEQGAHQDGIQVTSGNNIVIRHNTVDMNVDGANGGIYTCCWGGGDMLIENNIVAGGQFAVTGGGGIFSNTRVINNRISTKYYANGGYWGPFAYTGGDTFYGNVWHETGAPIN